MKRYFRTSVVVFCLVFGITGLSHAQAEKWEIDKDHSAVYFDVRHTYATVRGLFEEFSGTVVFEPGNEKASSVEFTVKVGSVNTQIEQRDDHLRSDDFFSAAQYPDMTFSSTRIRHAGDERYVMEGELTIKSVTREVEIPFTYLGKGKNPLDENQKVAGFEARFTVNRLDYNVGTGQFAELGVVGEEVSVLVTLTLLKDLQENETKKRGDGQI